jgi:PAS domain S-box-containing protein
MAAVTSVLITAAHLFSAGSEQIPVERHLHCVLWVCATAVTAVVVLQRLRARDELDQFFALSRDIMCIASLDGNVIRINNAGKKLFGLKSESCEAAELLDRVAEQDLVPTLDIARQISSGQAVVGVTTRIRDPLGALRFILWSVVTETASSRVFLIGRDTSDQALALRKLELSQDALAESEAALRKLNARLIQASEDEHRRLARELHDGVSQRLALLAGSAVGELRNLSDEVGEIADDVRRISHRLHPAILDNVGLEAALEAALEAECELFHRTYKVEASCESRNCPGSIRPDVALELYRITQEALTNVARHAKATWVKVALSGVEDHLVLSIVDSGVGFETQAIEATGGLGLTSMRERALQIGANLAVASMPNQGTEIEVEVELEQDKEQ